VWYDAVNLFGIRHQEASMAPRLEGGKTARQLVVERESRIMDAIHLKPTDRVPIICGMGYFPAKYAGIPSSAAYYDFNAWIAAYRKTLINFPADMIYHQGFTPGKALEILKPNNLRWPGYGVDPYKGHQSIEIESMQPGDYDAYIADPSDYMFRTLLSRSSDELAGWAKLPRLSSVGGGLGAQGLAVALTDPDVDKAIKVLQRAGRELRKWQKRQARFAQMMLDCGFPQYFQGNAGPPFDRISIAMRGMRGTMLDLYRQPDKVVAACNTLLKVALEAPMPRPDEFGNARIFMTVTRGSDNFMSKAQFDKFYWPTFKKLVTTLIQRGATPCIFFEGEFGSKLEYLLDIPKGKMLARLDTTDIQRAKDILKGHTCIQGNVPSTLLQTGSVKDVRDYCKRLIDTVGKDGGFILSPRSSTDEVKPANLKAMIDFTHQYGVYA
jgi:hypothetical protein